MHAKLSVAEVTKALCRRPTAYDWLASFLAGGLLTLALFFSGLAVLRAFDRLPSPPISGTWCIDSRFAWLRDAPQWKDAALAAVGSSATWRNLDFAVAPETMKRRGIVNASPCFLTINQTRYLAEYILERAPTTKTLLTVLTLRDLEGCSRNPTAFFDPKLADEYIDGRSYAWWLYFRNFRFTDIVLHAFYASDRRALLHYDEFGSGPITRDTPDTGHPVVSDPSCFTELRRFAQMLEAKGVQFIVVTFPVMPGWAERNDNDGIARAGFRAGIEVALASTNAILVDGMAGWSAPDSAFADPVHLQWPETANFTRFVWETARQRGAQLPPMEETKQASDSGSTIAGAIYRPIANKADPLVRVSNHSRTRDAPPASDPGKPPGNQITTRSPLLDAVVQNTPGHSEAYAAGVPRSYDWCRGSYKPPNLSAPPPEFTAVTGWGQIYAMAGAPTYSNPDATIEIANASTWLRVKSTRKWILAQEQTGNPIAGAYFAPDFAPSAVIPLRLERQPQGGVGIGPPPSDRNAHFWMYRRGAYPAESVDAVYVQMDIRMSDPNMSYVANVGADWWRDSTAKPEQGFANNPGAGMSNWIKLSTEWSTLRFYSLTTSELLAAPPPPLIVPSRDAGPPVTRRRAIGPAPCMNKLYEPLPKALVRLEQE